MAKHLNQKRIRQIVRRYGLNALKSTPVASLYRKNAVIQVQTKTGTYALKPFLRNNPFSSSPVQQMKTAANHIRLLMNRGYPYMPHWLSASSGKLWISSHGKPFYMTEWINGRCPEMPGDFEHLGRALATLHTTPSGLPAAKHSATLSQIRMWKIKDSLFRKHLAHASRNNMRFKKWTKRYGPVSKRLADQAWAEVKRPEISHLFKKERDFPALIHSDITSPNVLIAEDGRLFIIDWDRIMAGSIYVDTAKTLMNTTGFNPESILSFLKGYEEIRPLSQPERKLITALYGLPREAWYAIRFPGSSRSGEMLDIMNRTWPLRIQAMELLRGWANQ